MFLWNSILIYHIFYFYKEALGRYRSHKQPTTSFSISNENATKECLIPNDVIFWNFLDDINNTIIFNRRNFFYTFGNALVLSFCSEKPNNSKWQLDWMSILESRDTDKVPKLSFGVYIKQLVLPLIHLHVCFITACLHFSFSNESSIFSTQKYNQFVKSWSTVRNYYEN